MRKTGLEPPYNRLQIATWFLFPLFLADFLLFNTPSFSTVTEAVVVTAVYICSAITSLYFGYTTCVTDPIDQMLERHLAKQNGSKNLRSDDDDEEQLNETTHAQQHDPEDTKHCWVCQTSVKPKSLHCKFCNKCVSRFDHHCQWLNTCVGERNYKLFFRTVIATFCFVGFHLGTNVYLVLGYYVGYGSVKDDVDGTYIGSTIIYPIIIFGIILALTLALITQLLLFHISLQRQGITTYEYIVRHNSQKMEDKKKKDRLSLQRAAAVAVNKGNGKSTFCLKLGAYCKICDPLQKGESVNKTGALSAENTRSPYGGRMSKKPIEGMGRSNSQELMRANSSGTNSRSNSLRNSKVKENSGQKNVSNEQKGLDEMEEVKFSRSGHAQTIPLNGGSPSRDENTLMRASARSELNDSELTAKGIANLSAPQKENDSQITFFPIKSREEEQKVELDRDDIMVNNHISI